MNIQLSDHFNYKKLMQFVLPSIGMMIFTSIYGVVDGFFVSNYAGSTPFAAINLIMPFLMIFSAVGFMIGTGGTALVSLRLGEGEKKEANSIFSLLVYLVIVVGIIMTVVGELELKRVAIALGATKKLLPYCIKYGRIIMLTLVPFMLTNLFQSFLVAAEKPKIGLIVTIAAGLSNIFLDWLLVGVLKLGVAGAAYATCVSQLVGGVVPLIYFIIPNSSKLRLGATRIDGKAIWKSCFNGSSEFLVNISMSLVNMLYNAQLLKLAGENGVAAYGVLMYVNFIFIAVFFGYAIGTAPIVGFNQGAGNHEELHNIFNKSLKLIGVFAILMFALSNALAYPLSKLYVGYDKELLAMTMHAFRVYTFAFLVMGFNIYGSSFFTALNNGLVSAIISFARTLVFQILSIEILPIFFGLNGVWCSVILAECLSLVVTISFWVTMRKKYRY